MSRRSSILVLPLLAALSACASVQTQVTVEGSADDRARLAGHWEGEFESGDSPRNGIMDFDLAADSDVADAVVVLTPHEPPPPPEGEDRIERRGPRPGPLVLEFTWIRIRGDELQAELRPYDDPFGGGEVVMSLRGEIRGDVIEGTWSAVRNGPAPRATGRWTLRRIEGR